MIQCVEGSRLGGHLNHHTQITSLGHRAELTMKCYSRIPVLVSQTMCMARLLHPSTEL